MKNNVLFKFLTVIVMLIMLMNMSFVSGAVPAQEMRGIWISFLEMQTMLTGKTEAQFTANISTAMDNIANYGLNTVFVQVRPYGDALYRSEIFPWSHIVTGTEGKDPGFDPLEIMVEEAHSRGLRIEAWINPYRIRSKDNTKALSRSNPAYDAIKNNDGSVVKYGNMISYNPASTKAQNLIVSGVREIVRNYNVDGIHIDDYFYPVTGTDFDKKLDAKQYNAYVGGGGKMTHANWRRSNVETLIKKIYRAVKEENTKTLFGISPASNLDHNYSVQFLDVEKIVSNSGYCDYVIPQIYFGFQNTVQPFDETMDRWNELLEGSKVKLYVGIAAYKVGVSDGNAGKDEWKNSTNRLASMVAYAREESNYQGFVLYRYDQFFRPVSTLEKHVRTERSNLKNIL